MADQVLSSGRLELLPETDSLQGKERPWPDTSVPFVDSSMMRTRKGIRYNLYSEALEALTAGNDLPNASIHVCDICGNTVVGDVPDKCSVCGAPKAKFEEVA
jgi:hypothetical protein